jgi:hypothetical protein
MTRPKVIITCFAGRRRNMELLLLYTDSDWLDLNFQRAPLISTPNYDYLETKVTISEGENFKVGLRSKKDAHILLTNPYKREVAEICLGAYNNSCSFLRGHKDIETDIFQFRHCVEEFALQSICCNFGDYYYLGNGTEELRDEQLDPSRFTRKLPR